ncbi:class I adenylate-forming enzyme family protein [Paenibacillus sp. BJ-4]|uniref:class I adenylate-forming enzyme family protein n=1 Tax=Paenibacillus sp. BJ-4 TaxID=2878097 RepID=UPI001CF02A0E|nr:class I adenylate-forming enzyme family protein [Paenibacillus sp. BJ-4]
MARLKESNKTGIVCGETALSYKQWHQLSEELNNEGLRNQRGKIVGLFLPNSIAYAASYFACLYADKVIAPFHTGSTMNELLYTIKHCGISILITTESHFSQIETLLHAHAIPMSIIVVNDNAEIQKKVALYTSNVSLDISIEDELNDVAVLLHTSGTTSRPKRVMLTNQGLLNNIESHCKSLNYDDKEVCLIQLPMMFGYCNTAQFLAHVYLGACIVINPNPFMVADFYRIIEKWGITNFTAVPSILIALNHSNLLSYDISSLKVICFGGNPIPKPRLLDIIRKFPTIAFVQTYGLTEAGPRVTTLPPSRYNEKIGSVGRAIPGVELRVVDTLGQPLEKGAVGEVIVKSNGIMKGYFRCAEETMAIMHGEWLHTGDMGYLSEDGYLYIVGRKKNIIISGGQNISPEEVEEVIATCPGIIDAKVYGVYDDLLGEIVYADIVADSDNNEILQQLKLVCEENLSKYKIPRRFCLVDNICRTYNGKIKRSAKKVDECFDQTDDNDNKFGRERMV